jgi:hypothetical protein
MCEEAAQNGNIFVVQITSVLVLAAGLLHSLKQEMIPNTSGAKL